MSKRSKTSSSGWKPAKRTVDSLDILYALGRSSAILLAGVALTGWAFKSSRQRVWIWWTVVVATVLSFLPFPRFVVAIPRRLELPAPVVYEAGGGFSGAQVIDPSWPSLNVSLITLLVVGAVLFGIRMFLTWRYLCNAEQIAGADILNEAADIGSSVGIKRIPLVLTSSQSDSAYATGMLNPAIVLPQEMASAAQEDERRAILCHEMLHVKRRDHWFVALIDLWCCLFFWNPVAWFGRNLALNSMEEANDERTISSGLVSKAAYVRALVAGTHPLVAAPIARFHGQGSLASRIKSISNGSAQPTDHWHYLACFAIVLLAFPFQLEAMPSTTHLQANLKSGIEAVRIDEIIFGAANEGEPARAYRMRLDGSAIRPLLATQKWHGQSDMSPDGTRVAFIRGDEDAYDIFVSDLDGQNLVTVADHPGNDVQPHFSPDGTKIVYTSRRDQIWQIYLYNLENGETTRISDPRYRELEAKWHPNGKRIIFASYRTGSEKIWSKNLDGTDLVQITYGTEQDTAPIYSRCGRYVFFSRTSGGGYDIYRMDLAKRVQLRLTHALGDDGEPCVSSDNQWVFFTTGRNKSVNIGRMRLDGTRERVVTAGEGAWPQARPISGPFPPAR
jgi:Tol biopolymer transport system component/beta-lactamase regulating signal transducer with metallopeptidase domain